MALSRACGAHFRRKAFKCLQSTCRTAHTTPFPPRVTVAAADGGGAAGQQQQKEAKVLDRQVVAEGRFLRLVQLQYTRPPRSDVVRQWQAVERCTTRREEGSHGIDAVAVFAVVKSTQQQPQLVVVKQFRPPLGMTTIELPAGLVDGGEDPQETALRELREETGYTAARVLGVGGRQYLSPGLTNENIATVFVEVDGDALEGGRPAPQALEEDETIEVTLVPLGSDLEDHLRAYEAEGYAVWVGLHAIAQGLRLGAMLGTPL